ncbi:MAG: transglycosylase domain-containing protein [Paracoccaceae bacterium]
MARRKKTEKKTTAKPTDQPGLIGRAVRGVIRMVFGLVWRLGVVVALIVAAAAAFFYAQLPAYEKLFDGRGVGSVTLRDADGAIFAWRGEQYGGDLSVDQASPHLVNAVIAAEDKRFYRHIGLDPRGIARAMYVNMQRGAFVQGGSPLTQQVAKNVFLNAERSLARKIKEVPMALALEFKYSKEQILSIYLNRVYLGAGTYGFEAAAQRYFGKSARVVTPAEAAMLAGLLRAPSRYAPTNDITLAQRRANVIARLMFEQGYLSEIDMLEIRAKPAVLSDEAAARAGGAFADWVMERGGEDKFLDLLKTADIEIETTFDLDTQRSAEQALADVFDTKVREGSEAQAAIVVMTYDGAVKAVVGGRERGPARFNRATQALRQTGSAFKPIVYAAGIEAGLSPLDVFEDKRINIRGWSPSNYNNRFTGPVTLREALAKSINTVAVQVSEQAGRAKVRELAGEMGLSSEMAPGPAIALGTSEARLIEMTGVFATIANGGRRAVPHGVTAIKLRGDELPIDRGPVELGPQVISARTAGLLTNMMEAVVTDGTGGRARMAEWQVAGKTGTTQKARDAWFIGFTADYVAGVWMGYDDNRPLTGVTGGGLPAEIWQEVMNRIHAGRTPRPLNSIAPQPREPLIAERTPDRDGGAGGGDSLVERIFRDVVRDLTGDEPAQAPDWNPEAGSDR